MCVRVCGVCVKKIINKCACGWGVGSGGMSRVLIYEIEEIFSLALTLETLAMVC